MKKHGKFDFPTLINDIVLIGTALLLITITLLDFLGVLDQLDWLFSRVQVLTLLSLSFLLLSTVFERRSRLDTIQSTLNAIIANYTFGTRYLDDERAVVPELERAVSEANETIMALGAKSRASDYLEKIEEAVKQRDAIYYRLIDGTFIPHELHEHLERVIASPNVQISWTPREKFGNLTVTENECIIAFPAPYLKFSGLLLPGQVNSRRYTQYFLEAFSKALPVRTEKALQALCNTCNPDIAGNVAEVRRLIEEELGASFLETQYQFQPDLM